MRLLTVFILALAFSTSAKGEDDDFEREQPFKLPDTAVINLPTATNNVDYQLYIHAPPACRIASAECPVIYMLDAEYSFALSVQIVTHLADRRRIPAVISVAIAYRDKSQYRMSRTRDYTPFFFATGGYGDEFQKNSGGGPAFLNVIREDIIPFVEANYAASEKKRTLIGHSYGALFATYAWINAPEIFENYIIVSPSLWYGDGLPLTHAALACANSSYPKQRNLFLAVGEYEEQPQNGRAMVSDLKKLKETLDTCTKRTPSTYLRIFEDETHASVFPGALSTGLRKHFQ